VKLVLLPAFTVALLGWVVMVGAVFTVRDALLELVVMAPVPVTTVYCQVKFQQKIVVFPCYHYGNFPGISGNRLGFFRKATAA